MVSVFPGLSQILGYVRELILASANFISKTINVSSESVNFLIILLISIFAGKQLIKLFIKEDEGYWVIASAIIFYLLKYF